MNQWIRCYVRSDGNMTRGAAADCKKKDNDLLYSCPGLPYVIRITEKSPGEYQISSFEPTRIGDNTFIIYYWDDEEFVDIHEVLKKYMKKPEKKEEVKELIQTKKGSKK